MKTHYHLLDGLRGVAALLVIAYHIFEGFATSPADQLVNHGYLAVDFFFILSGFVMGYAYDNAKLTTKSFFKRRLIRLHPMVVMGIVIGVVAFVVQGMRQWDNTPVGVLPLIGAAVMGALLLPVWPGAKIDVRGNGEMFPLNGPTWSLFFEYIANIAYILCLRRLGTKSLRLLTLALGAALLLYALFNLSGYGHIGVGWTLGGTNFIGGLLRVGFSYSAGLLLSRTYKTIKVRGAFWICTAVLWGLLCLPYMGCGDAAWTNGLFDSICVLLVFPCLIVIAASGQTTDAATTRICNFLGDISYPLYVVHYPFMYLFFAHVWDNGLSFAEAWPFALAAVGASILTAWLCLKFYDRPVRKWLSKKYN